MIDAQGGGVGRGIIRIIKEKMPQIKIIAAGTNALATSAMLKAGADIGATGENAVLYACENADIIIAPIGLMIPDAMYGEITPAMALAFGKSRAKKILVPVKQGHVEIAGLDVKPLAQSIEEAAGLLLRYLERGSPDR